MFVAAPAAGAMPVVTSTPATFATAGQRHVDCHLHVDPPYANHDSIEATASTSCGWQLEEVNARVALEKWEYGRWQEVAWERDHRHQADRASATARYHCDDGHYRTAGWGDAKDRGDKFYDHQHSHEVHIHCEHHTGLAAS
jgi:hypothetical protein